MSELAQAQQPASDAAWLTQRERGAIAGIRVMFWMATALGRGVVRQFVRLIAFWYFAFDRRARAASREFLSRAYGRPATVREVYGHILRFARVTMDRVFLLLGNRDTFAVQSTGHDYLAKLARELGQVVVPGTLNRERVAVAEQQKHAIHRDAREAQDVPVHLAHGCGSPVGAAQKLARSRAGAAIEREVPERDQTHKLAHDAASERSRHPKHHANPGDRAALALREPSRIRSGLLSLCELTHGASPSPLMAAASANHKRPFAHTLSPRRSAKSTLCSSALTALPNVRLTSIRSFGTMRS